VKTKTNALVRLDSKPDDYQIPQTVTSPVERREIRNFIGMRMQQIKRRLDRIYRHKKEMFVAEEYRKRADEIVSRKELVSLVKEYNKDNSKIIGLIEQREVVNRQLERLCEKKRAVSEKLAELARESDMVDYSFCGYSDAVKTHARSQMSPEELIAESKLKDQIKAAFDERHSESMQERNRKLEYLNEKIEERLLFGRRDEIQRLFCELEQMNCLVEQELVALGCEEHSSASER